MKNNDHPYPYFNMVEKMTRFGCGAIHRYIIDRGAGGGVGGGWYFILSKIVVGIFFYWYSHK